jgi:CelD/BcsL family acetyltransferase involved in cellulose biosynthesis
MNVRPVESLAEFDGLAPVWAEVARESGQTSPFLSHDWFACCWRAAARTARPLVLLVEDSAGPIALVPLLRSETRLRGMRIRLLGVLEAPDTPFSDWLVVGPAETVTEAVTAHLAARKDWDLMVLDKLPAESRTVKALSSAPTSGIRVQRAATIPSPYVTVTSTWETFWEGKSQRFKKTFRSVRNRLEKAGAVSVEEHRAVPAEGGLFAEVLELSLRSWKGPRGLAMASMPAMPEFFGALTTRASARGWLRLWMLRLDGRAVAYEYQIEAEGRVHGLRADFDAGLPGDLSPGAYLNGHIVRALFDCETVHEYDMGPGDNEYKSRWATGSHDMLRLRLFHPGLYGLSLHALETRAVPALKRLTRGLGAS